jgi:trk system potassium uptake protein TrkH
MFLGTSSFEDVTARERTIPKGIIYQAVLTFLFSLLWIFIVLLILLSLQKGDAFIVLLFEAVSAFGTVGLSTGLTPHLKGFSKCIIIITMFIGRLGSLTIFSVFLKKSIRRLMQAGSLSTRQNWD